MEVGDEKTCCSVEGVEETVNNVVVNIGGIGFQDSDQSIKSMVDVEGSEITQASLNVDGGAKVVHTESCKGSTCPDTKRQIANSDGTIDIGGDSIWEH